MFVHFLICLIFCLSISDFVFTGYDLGCLCVLCFFHFLKFWFVCSACLFSKEKEEEGVGLGKRRGGRIWKGELWPKFIA